MKRILILLCLLILPIGQACAGMLNPGQGLSAGEKIYSNNAQYYATMQTDGNFVVYTVAGTALWSTKTTGSGANWAVMQSDGNFVLYNTATGAAVWSSDTTYNLPGYAAITDYGQWIVFKADPVWESNTSDGTNPSGANAAIFGNGEYFTQGANYTAGQYHVTFQTDGNFVIYSPTKSIWSTATTGKGAAVAYVEDASLIVDKASHTITNQSPALYQSNYTVPNNGNVEWNAAYLALRADGDLVMYVPQRVFVSPSPYAPTTIPPATGPGCYGPPDACFGSTLPIYNYTF